MLFGEPTSAENYVNSVSVNAISESAQPKNSLVMTKDVCENSGLTEDDNQVSPMPGGQQEAFPDEEEEAVPCLDEQGLDQKRNKREALRKIMHAGRTKEGLDNDRFEKKSGCRKIERKKVSFADRKIVIRKRLGRYGSKANRRRSMRRRIFKMMMEAEQEKRKAKRNLTEDTSQDGEPACKQSTLSKTPDNNNSWSSNNAKKFKYIFSRKTGKAPILQIIDCQNLFPL